MTVTRHDIDWGAGGVRPSADRASWPFSRTDKGKPHSNLHNIGVVLDHEPTLIGIAWYDEFLERILTGVPAKEWTDHDDVAIAMRLQDEFGLVGARPQQVREVLEQRVRASPRHCVRDWLSGLTWDAVPRIAEAFEDHWGVETGPDQPDDYVRAASANFLIALVARILRPGCKVDTMPVFEGPQGILKSSALEVLAGKAYFTVQHESVMHKDFFQVMTGKWLIEIAELDSFSRGEITRVKSVMSTSVDRYRVSYGRTAVDHARQSVFGGTTNKDDWGRDDTGLRRFWPIKCGLIDLESLGAARDQLFAEAVAKYQQKASWWQMPASAGHVQADRQADVPLAEAILPWLYGRTETTAFEVLTQALKLDPSRITAGPERDVARVLRLAGWTSHNRRREGKQTKLWIAPIGSSAPASDDLRF